MNLEVRCFDSEFNVNDPTTTHHMIRETQHAWGSLADPSMGGGGEL